jgi:hypothetical protein
MADAKSEKASRLRPLAWSASALLLLGACAIIPDGDDDDRRFDLGDEIVGRSMTVQAPAGTSVLSFRGDGSVTAAFGQRRTEGSWAVGDDRLCFTWAQNFRECWPYTRPFVRGEIVRIRSDRGNEVQVTLN